MTNEAEEDYLFYSNSPMQRLFNEIDLLNIEASEIDYKKMVLSSGEDGIKQTTRLLSKEVKWRYRKGRNVVGSIFGEQGLGKSMPFIHFSLFIASIFEKPFTVDNIYFDPFSLDDALRDCKPCETFLKDENPRPHGFMSKIVLDSLNDYEEQLRATQNNLLHCSVLPLKKSAHFFQFEALSSDDLRKESIDEPPESFFAILRTLNKIQGRFVWRGTVEFKMPKKDFVDEYNAKKLKHIQEGLQDKGNSAFTGFDEKLIKLFKENENRLIETSREGFVKPIPSDALLLYLAREFKAKYSTQILRMIASELKSFIKKKYVEHNEKIFAEIQKIRLAELKIKKELVEEQQLKAEKRRNDKEELYKLKLEQEKQKNELKAKALLIKQELLKLKENESLK